MREKAKRLIVPSFAALVIAVASGTHAVAVEMTRPFEALEGARRDRIELDKRMKRDAAEQRRREEDVKAQQEAQRKRDAAAAKAAQAARGTSGPGKSAPAQSTADPFKSTPEPTN